jgi:hypothetical protein
MVFKEDAITALIQSQTLVRMDGTLGSYHESQAYAVATCIFFF